MLILTALNDYPGSKVSDYKSVFDFLLHIPFDVTVKKDIYNMLNNLFILADSQQ